MSIGKNIPHDSSLGHVTGTSVFIEDRPRMQRELLVLPVGVPCASGTLKSISYEKALKAPGVVAVLTAKDLHHNIWGTIVQEQPILVSDKIGYYDEPALLLVGDDYEKLLLARSLVTFEIEKAPAILSIDEAIAKQSFICKSGPMRCGDIDKAMAMAPHRLSGVFECGGQEHFYLESQACVAYPLEDGQIEIHSSSQHPSETQHVVAEALGLSLHQVVCVVKRMGGGFGGKESQAAPFAAMAAIVAQKMGLPARLILSKDDDMAMTGKRHPFKNFYDVAFDNEGNILGLKAHLYADGGAYADLSSSILDRALFHIDGAYYLPNAYIEGHVCRTNMYSNTAFRGFGGPQGSMTIESIIEEIATYLKIDALTVRERNCYRPENNVTHYGQKLENTPLQELFSKLTADSEYRERRKAIDEFNRQNPHKVRGLSMTATKFGIAFTARFLNQGNASVNVHKDGTVQVSTGATEMGQGVNTKIQQIVAHCFGIDAAAVKVMATSTEKNHNTSPTAASSGADINGAAALKAAEGIKKRLAWVFQLTLAGAPMDDVNECPPLNEALLKLEEFEFKDGQIKHLPSGKTMSWNELLMKAYFNRLSLGEYAHFKTEGLGYDKAKGVGTPFKYFTNGVAASEVEIDVFTGEYKVLRTDILMDLGRSLNPGIDRGQVTGAFVQAMGWVTTEKLYHNKDGKLLSHSPTTYKIPNVQDTPRIFNVDFIENNGNTANVHRSKAVGEPPFLLGISVWTAIKDALRYKSRGAIPQIISPATPEVVLMELAKYESSKL
ncbi:xanthine dehydrogenase molybdopterin binding subunit [Bdellovibrio svalbardensis]|uniref:Xanthine dehydrogenase molybdopterin binding subunit n=1 Tax=Bdellovibrio svalbardensis TaxID=2972972 RepID=A0ABT6DGL8_9BACT|nr:xanthine dehydrogenase molybdopterin binding subunit [Bdellovibrio svalbardensis]MDG0815985.1 xanthine dehydrogenase molybdopterin binding subunit [Bdellovibrio svalbardensis]